MKKPKRIMQSVERDKSWAEKMELRYCHCRHINTIHAGGVGDCAFIGCTCQEFKERMASSEPPRSAFQKVKEEISK